MPLFLRLLLTPCALFVSVGFCPTVEAQTARRIPAFPVDSQLVVLPGNISPPVGWGNDLGPIAPDTQLDHLLLDLRPSATQQAQLDALLQAQSDPASPLFHQWLTPSEFGVRFGAGADDLATISAWLQLHGFTVDETAPSHLLIEFSGSAGQVAETFHTEIHRYKLGAVEHVANQQDPQIPAAFAGLVEGIVSLNDIRHTSQISARRPLATRPGYSSGGTHYLFPADWAAIYDLAPLYAAGTSGTGTSIAIVGRSNIHLADVASFRSATGLPANAPSIVLVGTDPGLLPGDQDESTLDVEWSGAIAPAASVKFVVGASTATTDGIDLSAQYAVNHAVAPVVSTSYGSCEQEMGATELAFYNSLWQQAASQGMTVLVSSGDSGAAGCDAGSAASGTVAAVNGLCSSPYATCVGGTEFDEGSNPSQYWSTTNTAPYGSALGYIPEEVWNESALNGGAGLWASTGGASIVYPSPAWQKNLVGTSSGMRAVPDVAFTAAGHDGYIIQENGSFWIISGTSAAAPSFAGIMALVVQSQGGKGQGNVNPTLYGLDNSERSPFHPTPSGSNSVPGVLGFTATGESFNQATGLGSADAAELVAIWPSASAGALALSVSPAELTMQSLATAIVKVTAAPSEGPAIRGAVKPSGSINPQPAWIRLRGGPVRRSPITTSAGAPTIEIVSGLPDGLNATWNAPDSTPAGGVVWTLTLKGSSNAIAGESTLTLAATVTSATSAATSTATATLPITVILSPPSVSHTRLHSSVSMQKREAENMK